MPPLRVVAVRDYFTKVDHAHALNGATIFISARNASSEYPSQPMPTSDKPAVRHGKNLE